MLTPLVTPASATPHPPVARFAPRVRLAFRSGLLDPRVPGRLPPARLRRGPLQAASGVRIGPRFRIVFQRRRRLGGDRGGLWLKRKGALKGAPGSNLSVSMSLTVLTVYIS